MKYLVLGSGSQGFFMMLGYLKKIEKELTDLEEISCASAGSLLGLCIAAGKTLDEILDFSIHLDIESLIKMNLKNLLKNFGFIDTQPMRQKFVEFIGADLRFKDLKLNLHISAMCLNTSSTVYFSRDTHPNMKVCDAVCASCSIPIMFVSYKIDDKLYIDGATLEELPAFPFLNKNGDDVFCVRLKSPEKTIEKVADFRDYIMSVVIAAMKYRIQYNQFRTVSLEYKDINIFDLKLPVEDKLRLYLLGLT